MHTKAQDEGLRFGVWVLGEWGDVVDSVEEGLGERFGFESG